MKVEITKDKATGLESLHIDVPLTENKQSRTGNSVVIASSKGQQHIGKVRGKDTYLQLNVMQMEGASGGLEVVRGPEDEQDEARRKPAQRAA